MPLYCSWRLRQVQRTAVDEVRLAHSGRKVAWVCPASPAGKVTRDPQFTVPALPAQSLPRFSETSASVSLDWLQAQPRSWFWWITGAISSSSLSRARRPTFCVRSSRTGCRRPSGRDRVLRAERVPHRRNHPPRGTIGASGAGRPTWRIVWYSFGSFCFRDSCCAFFGTRFMLPSQPPAGCF